MAEVDAVAGAAVVLVRLRTVQELADLPPGVVPVAQEVDVGSLEQACDERGRPMVLLVTESVHDKSGFMDAVSEALALPGWFGRNWDALAECLADVPRTTVLVWDGWTDMARATPRDTEVAIEVLAESGLTVLMVKAPAEETGPAEESGPAEETGPEGA